MSDRLFVNADRTVLVTVWEDGSVFVSVRAAPDDIWGPPVEVVPEPAAFPKKQNPTKED